VGTEKNELGHREADIRVPKPKIDRGSITRKVCATESARLTLKQKPTCSALKQEASEQKNADDYEDCNDDDFYQAHDHHLGRGI
jgi:hypothetical protein